MIKILYGILNGWHSRKGLNSAQSRAFEVSLEHYMKALKYAEETENVGTIAMELESIAKVHWALGNREDALQYAAKSFKLFDEHADLGPYIKAGRNRVKKMIQELEGT